MKNEKQIKSFLKSKLSSDSAWACRAVVKLYERQTAAEQSDGVTKEHNNVGFSGTDSEFLSSIAEQLISGRNLSTKQMEYVFKKVQKYWRQIWSMIPSNKQDDIVSKLKA